MTDHAALTEASREARIVGSSQTRVFGLSAVERLERLFATKGIEARPYLEGDAPRENQDSEGPQAASVIGVLGDHVYEPVLITNLLEQEGRLLCLPGGRPVAFHVPASLAEDAFEALRSGRASAALAEAVEVVRPADLAYNKQLRKRATPYVLPVTSENERELERQIFAGSYKGVTDIATKYLFPWPVRQLTRAAAALRLRPNHVTSLSLLLTLLATYLFHEGRFGEGLVAAWGMCILDSVDGKLARVTLTSSKFGDYFDHAIDLIHPPFWYWAFMVGLGGAFAEHPLAGAVFWTIMVLYVAQRLLEGLFMTAFGIEMHIWRPFDSAFRLVTARRNPNLLILTAAVIVGRPLEGMLLVGAWTAASFVVHLVQVIQASVEKASRRPVVSWLTQDGPKDRR